MGYALMWIEGMAAMLLSVALTAACSARWSRRRRQLALPLATAFAILIVALLVTHAAGWGKFYFHLPHNWFYYTLSWTVLFFVGSGIIVRRGLKRKDKEGTPPARFWPRVRLFSSSLAALVLFAITLSNLDLALQLQLAEVRAEAGSVLSALTPPPALEKDNAAPLYEEAFAMLPQRDPFPSSREQRIETWSTKHWQQAHKWDLPDSSFEDFDWRDPAWKKYLDSRAKVLSLLRRAAAKPACRFPQSDPLIFFDGASRRYSPESDFAQASQLLALDACVRAARGEPHAAVEDIVALLGMARQTTDAAIEKEAWETLAEVLRLSEPKADDLSRLSHIEGEPYLRDFRKVEASFVLRSLLLFSTDFSSRWYWDTTKELPFLHRKGPMPEGYEAPFWFESTIVPLWRVFLGPDELLVLRRSLKACQESLRRPEMQTFVDWRALLQSLRNQEGGWVYMGSMQTRLQSNARWACDVATLRRLSRLALALRMYRDKHGKYAEKLDDLTPDFLDRPPTDPWDSGPLHMKRTEGSVVLFTLRNGTENPISSPDFSSQRRDIVFRVGAKKN